MLGKKDVTDFGANANLNTIIGKGSSFEGILKVQSTLRVDGLLKGTVTTSESLVIGKEGAVNGDITVRNAIIGGKVKGKLVASGKVVLEANSEFSGELKTSKLVIDEGAIFDGNCTMDENENGPRKKDYGRGITTILDNDNKELAKEEELKSAK